MFISTALWIYLYIVIGNLLGVAIAIGFAAMALGGGCWMFGLTEDEESWRDWGKGITKPAIICLIIVCSLKALYPSTDELKTIFGGSAVITAGSAIVNTEGAKQLPDNIVNAVNQFLGGVAEDTAE